jgi:hypothetical protein
MESSDLVVVATVPDMTTGELIKNMLRAEGIRCFLGGEESTGNLGIPAFSTDVLVPALDSDRARKLIAEHERHHRQK